MLRDEHFDITTPAENRAADDDEIRLMLQALLTDCFGLKIHREQKDQPIYS